MSRLTFIHSIFFLLFCLGSGACARINNSAFPLALLSSVNSGPGAIVKVDQGNGLMVAEGSGGDTYTLALNKRPGADVIISPSSGQCGFAAGSYTFTPNNWNIAQVVKVSALVDSVGEGTHSCDIFHDVSSLDQAYEGLSVTKLKAMITERVLDNSLLLYYDFNEGSGNIVKDSAPGGEPLDLTIDLPKGVAWGEEGGLAILNNGNDVRIQSSGPATKVIKSLQASNSMSLEVWVTPANDTQDGPKRMFSFSKDFSERNFTFGQQGQKWIVRRRLDVIVNGDVNGIPNYESPQMINVAKTHVVYTRTSAGLEKIYVNGVEEVSQVSEGNFSNWDADMPFIVGNEQIDSRLWEGSIYLAAVYSRALSGAEVNTNFNAGSE